MTCNTKLESFRDLIVWQKGHVMVTKVYKVTKTFPREELYSLTDQMKRASVSITSNIAEGFSRHSRKEKTQFYVTARASCTELENQIIVAKDVGYISECTFNDLVFSIQEVSKMLLSLIIKTKS